MAASMADFVVVEMGLRDDCGLTCWERAGERSCELWIKGLRDESGRADVGRRVREASRREGRLEKRSACGVNGERLGFWYGERVRLGVSFVKMGGGYEWIEIS